MQDYTLCNLVGQFSHTPERFSGRLTTNIVYSMQWTQGITKHCTRHTCRTGPKYSSASASAVLCCTTKTGVDTAGRSVQQSMNRTACSPDHTVPTMEVYQGVTITVTITTKFCIAAPTEWMGALNKKAMPMHAYPRTFVACLLIFPEMSPLAAPACVHRY